MNILSWVNYFKLGINFLISIAFVQKANNTNIIITHLFYLSVFTGLWYILDYLLLKYKSRWFMIHCIANSINVFFSYRDVLGLLADPLFYKDSLVSYIPPNVTISLHVYHAIAYSNLTFIDWMHHVVMMIALSFTYFFPIPELNNFSIFFVCGLPGGIDYLLLVLTKEFNLNPLIEKRYNSYLNVWIRCPGIIITAFILYIRFAYKFNDFPLYIFILIGSSLYWNGNYFMYRTVRNYGMKSERE